MTEFDPASHRMVPEQRWFEDFALGERFVIPSRTMTWGVFTAFQAASGDTHPVHYDVEYCRARGMPNLLAHGFQTLIHTAPGSGLFPYMVEESLVGFLEQSSRFLKPVYADDTIYPALEVTELVPGRSTGVAPNRTAIGSAIDYYKTLPSLQIDCPLPLSLLRRIKWVTLALGRSDSVDPVRLSGNCDVVPVIAALDPMACTLP